MTIRRVTAQVLADYSYYTEGQCKLLVTMRRVTVQQRSSYKYFVSTVSLKLAQ